MKIIINIKQCTVRRRTSLIDDLVVLHSELHVLVMGNAAANLPTVLT
jgi:hypothetical protein